jgi:hypothetical protein
MKIRIWHVIVFVVALVIFAVLMAPAAFFVRQHPGAFTYARVHGSIWNARLEEVQLGPYHAETARWRIAVLDVIQGKVRAPIDFEQGTIQGRVMLLANFSNDRRIFIPTLQLEGVDMGPRGAWPGEVRISNLDIFFEDGVCAAAQGAVYSDVFVRAGETLGWAGPPLNGVAACEGNDAVITVNGRNSAGEQVVGRMLLRGDGSGAWRVAVQGAQPETAAALIGAGLEQGDGEIGYGEDMRWLP